MTRYLNPAQFLAGIIFAYGLTPTLSAQMEPVDPELHQPSTITVSTIPPNGDLNPYGVAFVPRGFPRDGAIHPGDLLVSNFNSSANLQGTGTTITRVTPHGATSLFFQAHQPAGLTTALGCLKSGYVIVGNLPTTDGTSNTLGQGSLFVLDRWGNMVLNLTSSTLLNGPWDLTIAEEEDHAQVFVSDVLSGTVTRLTFATGRHSGDLKLLSETQIASGYTHRFDPAALVIGPTGLAYDDDRDILYVASTGDNAIYSVSSAKSRTTDGGIGTLVYTDNVHLHGPLGLVLVPHGHLIASNGDAVNPGGLPNELVEFTKSGTFVAEYQVDPGPGGGAFGIAIERLEEGIRFAAVDDNANTVIIRRIGIE